MHTTRKSAVLPHVIVILICFVFVNVLWAHSAFTQDAGDVLVITGDNLRLRSQPSTDSDVLATLSKGTTATIVDSSPGTDWVAIRLEDGKLGWVHKDYVSFVENMDERPEHTWFGDFTFATISDPEDEFVLHGHFDSGLTVRLMNADGTRHLLATTGEQAVHDGENFTFPITRLAGDVPSPENAHFSFAIVGNVPSLELLSLRAWLPESEARDAIREVHQRLEDASRYSENPETFRFGSEGQSGALLQYTGVAFPGEDRPTLMKQYVVVLESRIYIADVGCNGVPMLFKIGQEHFLFAKYLGCGHGLVGEFVMRLTPEGGTWTNYDYSM